MSAETRGYDHEAVYYSSDEELVAIVAPFLRDGVTAGQPTLVSMTEAKTELLRAAVPESPDITFMSAASVYERPAVAIKAYQDLMTGYVAGGAKQIRIVGEVPAVALTSTWDAWARYEAAVNYAYDEFPLWTMCAYDTRVTPKHILDDVASTHSLVAEGWDRHVRSSTYVEPPEFLSRPRLVDPYRIQHQPPRLCLLDPSPAAARQAVLDANRTTLSGLAIEDLVLSVSEVVTNALNHGKPPVRLTIWADESHMVVAVQDRGAGLVDPFAGLLPAPDRTVGGLGLWIAHQLCNHVAFDHDDGFTVRLVAGDPFAAG
jgi:anti-sigma regulatory factor (Ser/Thr protein kinase)